MHCSAALTPLWSRTRGFAPNARSKLIISLLPARAAICIGVCSERSSTKLGLTPCRSHRSTWVGSFPLTALMRSCCFRTSSCGGCGACVSTYRIPRCTKSYNSLFSFSQDNFVLRSFEQADEDTPKHRSVASPLTRSPAGRATTAEENTEKTSFILEGGSG